VHFGLTNGHSLLFKSCSRVAGVSFRDSGASKENRGLEARPQPPATRNAACFIVDFGVGEMSPNAIGSLGPSFFTDRPDPMPRR
jgi:hypothetical protein